MKPTEKEFTRYYKNVFGLARKLTRDTEEAKDLTQEVYRKAFQFIDKYKAGNPVGWLLRITYNTFIGDYHFNKRRLHINNRASEDLFTSDKLFGYNADPYKGHFSDEVMAALNDLREEDKQLVVLFYFYDLKYDEIVELTGVTLGTVKSRLFRARGQMKDKIRRFNKASTVVFA